MKRITDLLIKNTKLIVNIASPIAIATTAYLTEFYRSLDKTNYYGIPVIILLIVFGITIGVTMSITLSSEDKESEPYSDWRKIVETIYFVHKGIRYQIYKREDGTYTPESKLIYCPKCKTPLMERKTLLWGYKYECINCETMYKTKYKKIELIVNAFFAYKAQNDIK